MHIAERLYVQGRNTPLSHRPSHPAVLCPFFPRPHGFFKNINPSWGVNFRGRSRATTDRTTRFFSYAVVLIWPGYISYPRTESTTYPVNFDLRSVVETLRKSETWGQYAAGLLEQGLHPSKKGVDMGDHPPITPMDLPNPQDLGPEDWRVYRSFS